jgi:succinoglycan biosynthesis transport protein ExoP
VIAQAKALETEVTRISALGFQLQDLERRRELEEEKYRYFQTSLEKARLDETLDPSKMPNISVVQSPTPPSKSIDEKSLKLIIGIAFAGLAAGLALAFLIEMVIDRRVSRPVEIHTRLQLPLMLSIPYIRSKDGIGKLVGPLPALGSLADGTEIILPSSTKRNEIGKSERAGEHFITPFVAAIHDRIIFNFQINDITHKPKLVALTGLSEGAGTSTIAAGLAKAFADNGDRKVLLVNLNPETRGLQGHPASSLLSALQDSRSERFRLAPRNLYFASASTRRDSKDSEALAPADLHRLMPQLVASDFDYIVFDMPPIGPTSPTLTMAGFMDKVLLVLDGDNTTKENLSWAYSELENARADVSCIFNKARSHAPRWVQGEI